MRRNLCISRDASQFEIPGGDFRTFLTFILPFSVAKGGEKWLLISSPAVYRYSFDNFVFWIHRRIFKTSSRCLFQLEVRKFSAFWIGDTFCYLEHESVTRFLFSFLKDVCQKVLFDSISGKDLKHRTFFPLTEKSGALEATSWNWNFLTVSVHASVKKGFSKSPSLPAKKMILWNLFKNYNFGNKASARVCKNIRRK